MFNNNNWHGLFISNAENCNATFPLVSNVREEGQAKGVGLVIVKLSFNYKTFFNYFVQRIYWKVQRRTANWTRVETD